MKSPSKEQSDNQRPSLTDTEWRAAIAVMRSAPLNNMQHAEAVDGLIMKMMRAGNLVEQPPLLEEVESEQEQ